MFTLLFGDYTFPNLSFEVEGFPLENDISEETIIQKHGGIIQAPYLKARKFLVTGTIYEDTEEEANTKLMSLQSYLMIGEAEFKHREDRYITARAKSIIAKYVKGTDKRVIEVEADFVAENPYFLSAAATYSDATAIAGGTETVDVYNGGNVVAIPVFFIFASNGALVDDVHVVNQSDGDKYFKFKGTVADGTTLRIDTEILEVLNDSVAALTQFEGTFLTMATNTNTFQYIGAECTLTVERKYRWY